MYLSKHMHSNNETRYTRFQAHNQKLNEKQDEPLRSLWSTSCCQRACSSSILCLKQHKSCSHTLTDNTHNITRHSRMSSLFIQHTHAHAYNKQFTCVTNEQQIKKWSFAKQVLNLAHTKC